MARFLEPLLCDLVIREGLYEDTTHDRPRLESDFFSILCVVPIGQWDARWCFVHPFPNGRHQSAELVGTIRQGGRPQFPVQLGVVGSVIQRQPILIQMPQVEGQLRLSNSRRE